MRGLALALFVGWAALLVHESLLAFENASTEIQLQTELRLSGPAVSIKAPLGLRYRPGYAFPLQIRVHNPGPELNAELLIAKGDGSNAVVSGFLGSESRAIPAGASQQFTLPVRAPAVSANLSLILRAVQSGSSVRPEIFRASLARIFKPLPPEARVILVCGGAPFSQHVGLSHSAQVGAHEFPDQAWMYESIDWVVLGDGSFKDAPQAAKETLRLWLLGGGRLFLGSPEALSSAIAANLLPIDPKTSHVDADLGWWEKNAGLKKEDVLMESKDHHPIFARLRLGFGQTIFLFPAANPEVGDGAALFNRPDLQRVRSKLPDLRVQPERFDAFSYGEVGAPRRTNAILWVSIGALVFCAMLAYALTGRSKLEVLGLPLACGAVLTLLLAKWFPEPKLIASRIDWYHIPADGRAVVHEEWMLLEAFRQALNVEIAGPESGSVYEIHSDSESLRGSSARMTQQEPRLKLQNLEPAPGQPVLLYANTVIESGNIHSVPQPLNALSGGTMVDLLTWSSRLRPRPTHLLQIREHRTSLLKIEARGEYKEQSYQPAMLREVLSRQGTETVVSGRAAVLEWAIATTQDGLILWTDASADDEEIIRVENLRPETGSAFVVSSIGMSVKD